MAPLTEAAQGTAPQTARRARMAGPLLVAAIVGAATIALHVRDPHQSGSWGYCPWKLLTGWDCPGCGSLRAVNDLTRGDLVGAASSNLLFVAMVPVAVALWVAWARRSWTGAEARPRAGSGATRAVWLAAIVVTVAFTVLRNTPWGSWLHS